VRICAFYEREVFTVIDGRKLRLFFEANGFNFALAFKGPASSMILAAADGETGFAGVSVQTFSGQIFRN